jgi:hypothetical protein
VLPETFVLTSFFGPPPCAHSPLPPTVDDGGMNNRRLCLHIASISFSIRLFITTMNDRRLYRSGCDKKKLIIESSSILGHSHNEVVANHVLIQSEPVVGESKTLDHRECAPLLCGAVGAVIHQLLCGAGFRVLCAASSRPIMAQLVVDDNNERVGGDGRQWTFDRRRGVFAPELTVGRCRLLSTGFFFRQRLSQHGGFWSVVSSLLVSELKCAPGKPQAVKHSDYASSVAQYFQIHPLSHQSTRLSRQSKSTSPSRQSEPTIQTPPVRAASKRCQSEPPVNVASPSRQLTLPPSPPS